MIDIHDIQLFIFGFLYSYKYFIFIGIFLFFIWYFIILSFFFTPSLPIQDKTSSNNDDELKNLFDELSTNIHIYPKTEFYEKLSNLFLAIYVHKTWKKLFYVLTLQELHRILPAMEYLLFREIYLRKYDENMWDDQNIRRKLLEKIQNFLK